MGNKIKPAFKIWEEDPRNTTIRCNRCGHYAVVSTKNIQFAYTEINRFRGKHQHLKEKK